MSPPEIREKHRPGKNVRQYTPRLAMVSPATSINGGLISFPACINCGRHLLLMEMPFLPTDLPGELSTGAVVVQPKCIWKCHRFSSPLLWEKVSLVKKYVSKSVMPRENDLFLYNMGYIPQVALWITGTCTN